MTQKKPSISPNFKKWDNKLKSLLNELHDSAQSIQFKIWEACFKLEELKEWDRLARSFDAYLRTTHDFRTYDLSRYAKYKKALQVKPHDQLAKIGPEALIALVDVASESKDFEKTFSELYPLILDEIQSFRDRNKKSPSRARQRDIVKKIAGEAGINGKVRGKRKTTLDSMASALVAIARSTTDVRAAEIARGALKEAGYSDPGPSPLAKPLQTAAIPPN